MFELQMKEAMELLGLTTSASLVDEKFNQSEIKKFEKPNGIIKDDISTSYDQTKTCMYSINENQNRHRLFFPTCEEHDEQSKPLDTSYSMSGLFFKYQPDFVHSSFSFDNYPNKTVNAQHVDTIYSTGNQTDTSKSSSNTTSIDNSFTQIKMSSSSEASKTESKSIEHEELPITKSTLVEAVEKPCEHLNSRASELRNFIGKLLDKPPKEDASDKTLKFVDSTSLTSTDNDTVKPIVNVDKIGFRPIRSIAYETCDHDENNDYYHQFNRTLNKNFVDFQRSLNADFVASPKYGPDCSSLDKTANNDDSLSKSKQCQIFLKSPLSVKDSSALIKPISKSAKPVWK
jgi:hypothetical protein